MIVDDETFNIDVLVGILTPRYQVAAAKSGEQALQRLTQHPLPDLIFLDVMMPGLDGYQVCRQIKGDVNIQHIPVIFITGLTEEGDELKGFEAGPSITSPSRYDRWWPWLGSIPISI